MCTQICNATRRKYAAVPWEAPESTVISSLSQITSESGKTWTDEEALAHPSVALAEKLTGVLMDFCRDGSATPGMNIPLKVFSAWTIALASPSMCLKEKAVSILAAILHDVLPNGPMAVRRILDFPRKNWS